MNRVVALTAVIMLGSIGCMPLEMPVQDTEEHGNTDTTKPKKTAPMSVAQPDASHPEQDDLRAH